MKIQLWRCEICEITFGVRVEDADLYEITSEATTRTPCCPNVDCRDNSDVVAIGEPSGYEVAYEPDAAE